MKYPDFENGVCKIQRGDHQSLTAEEIKACKVLLKECNTKDSVENGEENLSIAAMISTKKRKRECPEDGYIKCDFILGSAAEVERLWSKAKHLLLDHRKRTSPALVEALLFLNTNMEYWDGQTVRIVMAAARSKRVQSAIEADFIHSNE